MSNVPVLQQHFREKLTPELVKEFGYSSVMQVPELEKITLNMGVGEVLNDRNQLVTAAKEMGLIAGQKPIICNARVSAATFKIRQGMPLGCKVTLRRHNMYDFLLRLVYIALPRVRDFQGLKESSFDGRGNYSFGIKEQIVFPEINIDNISGYRGMDITLTTTAKTDREAEALLRGLGLPLRKKGA